jgi:hypothetical protein
MGHRGGFLARVSNKLNAGLECVRGHTPTPQRAARAEAVGGFWDRSDHHTTTGTAMKTVE